MTRTNTRFAPPGVARCLAVLSLGVLAFGCGEPTKPVERNPWLVLQIQRDGNRDIWRMRLDGRDTLRLTTNPADDTRPTVARDLVVFVSLRDGNRELYSVPLSGGTGTRLSMTAANEDDPALSRDATRLAYVSDSTGVGRLMRANANFSGRTALNGAVSFGGSFDQTPDWSWSGDDIAFVSTPQAQPVLARVSGSGGTVSILYGAQPPNLEPSWSPDGRTIAFVSNRDGDVEIYLLTTSSGDVRRLTSRPGVDRRPCFLPDGRIIWMATSVDGTRLMMMNPDVPATLETLSVPVGVLEWVSVQK